MEVYNTKPFIYCNRAVKKKKTWIKIYQIYHFNTLQPHALVLGSNSPIWPQYAEMIHNQGILEFATHIWCVHCFVDSEIKVILYLFFSNASWE